MKLNLRSDVLNRNVDIYVYFPKSYDSGESFPVVYMHDGQNLSDVELTEYGHVWQVEDAFKYDVKEAIVVGISSPRGFGRRDELSPYKNNESKGLGVSYLDFVVDVVDYVDNEFNTIPKPEKRFLIGSSLGGFITTYAAAHYSHIFKGFGCLSNAYWFDERILEEVPLIKDVKFYMDVGTNEADDRYVLLNDLAYNLLENEDSFYIKVPGAVHNEKEWAVRLPIVLRWLLGGKE